LSFIGLYIFLNIVSSHVLNNDFICPAGAHISQPCCIFCVVGFIFILTSQFWESLMRWTPSCHSCWDIFSKIMSASNQLIQIFKFWHFVICFVVNVPNLSCIFLSLYFEVSIYLVLGTFIFRPISLFNSFIS
jgi:hypothetical protein